MYYIVIWHLHTLWNDHHDNKSSNHLVPYKVITVLLTIFLMLYMTSPWLIYYVTGGLYLLIPFIYFAHSPQPPPFWQPPICSLYLWIYFHIVSSFCFLDSTYKWDHAVFLFLWLISLSIIPSKSMHVVTNGDNFIFYGWVIFHLVYIHIYMCISHLLYPLIYWCVSKLLSYVGYCK